MDAIYTAPAGDPQALRVIRSQGSDTSGSMILDRDVVSIRAADVVLPVRRAQIQLLGSIAVADEIHDDPVFLIKQDPMLDEEGLSWSCAIELA
ncbi:hypothetical protein GGR39_002354 [Novosphingobium fluoreni]|uniref:Uncharacterized protein n=1 Tax=Novosphingobium fluoreni TaxID=1391222 RepID=A0A7W6G007_9SPHN|nr:hypothetical protein [Novosphingobium fluoreni]